MKIEEIKQKYLDKDCVVLTCGPSLREYPKEKICDFIKDKIVICVKESIVEYKDYAHFFIWNGSRQRQYNINSDTIKVFQDDYDKAKYCNRPVDIILPEDRPFNMDNQLLKTKKFKEYDLENNIKRPWGPGILYETVFYFCKYIGIKNVYTIGWDLIDKNNYTTVTHYFDNDDHKDYKASMRYHPNDQLSKEFFGEMLMVNEKIVHMYDYFKQEGMNIYVVGSQSYVNKHIPRINL